MADIQYCAKCHIIKSNHPGITFDQDGVCNLCNMEIPEFLFKNRELAQKNLQEFINSPSDNTRSYDCMSMLSGGKDSTYILYKMLKEKKKKILAYTYNIPYESKDALKNIDRILDRLNVDHIYLTNKIKYKKMMKFTFANPESTASPQYQAEKHPCILCSSYMIINACLLAFRMNIPYILYCADPIQSITFISDTKTLINDFVAKMGEEVSFYLFGEQLNILQKKDEKELPKIIFPYVGSAYNPTAIIAELKKAGLYESNPEKTHCSLWGLINYYAYKHYDCSFYTLEYATQIRQAPDKFKREAVIQFDRELKNAILHIATKKEIGEEEKERIRQIAKSITGDLATEYMCENIISIGKIAQELAIDLD